MNIDWNYILDISEKLFKIGAVIADISEKLFRIGAVVAGGLWVYFNFFQGRTFVPRLQLELSGKLLSRGNLQYLLVSMQVKNVGSSIVQLRARGTGLKVVSQQVGSAAPEISSLVDKATTAFPVLEKDIIDEKTTAADRNIKNIEPGTAINEQKLLAVNTARYNEFRLELKVFALGGRLLWQKLPDRHWTAIAVAAKDDQKPQTGKGR